MKALMFTALVLSTTAKAEVFSCPARYPAEDVTLSDTVPEGKAVGRVFSTALSSAYMISGNLYSEQDMVPDTRRIKGGRNVGFNLVKDPKWLVCVYGDRIQRWQQVDPKFTDCEVQIRQVEDRRGTPTKTTASATCK